jgi:hypothetical protein
VPAGIAHRVGRFRLTPGTAIMYHVTGSRTFTSATELMALFSDLPPMNAAEFRAEQDRYANTEAHFDASSRHQKPEDGE